MEEKRMPGYTGYKPQFADEEDEGIQRDNRYFIPGKFTKIFEDFPIRKAFQSRRYILT